MNPPVSVIRRIFSGSRAEREILCSRLRAVAGGIPGNARGRIAGKFRGNRIDAYWWDRLVNFGDRVTPALLRSYGFTPVWAPPKRAEVVSTGSVLEHVPDDFAGFIAGSGLIGPDVRRSFKNATVLAVRGRLTRDLIGAPEDTALGDPGLLALRFHGIRAKKRHALGIVPHYMDRDDVRIGSILRRLGRDVKLIRPLRDPGVVLEEIDACEAVLSSSLHGLVFADALGIPSGWVSLSDQVAGGGFKFHDYFSIFHAGREPVLITGRESLPELVGKTAPPPDEIPLIKQGLDLAFLRLKSEVEERRSAGCRGRAP